VFDYLSVSERELDSLYRFGVPYGATVRLNNMVVDKIIYLNLGKKPINYAVSVGGGPRIYLGRNVDSMAELSGMMWRLTTDGHGRRTDVEGSMAFFLG
jgi:hypothetical protein